MLGIATGDMGVAKDGEITDRFTRGMVELRGKYTLFAEGARGSLSAVPIARFCWTRAREPPKFGIGPKEICRSGRRTTSLAWSSTFGWPLDMKTGGGSFLYHIEDDQVVVGFVVHLNYDNPHLALQRVPALQDASRDPGVFEGGKRLAYGAAHHRGGYRSVPARYRAGR